MSIVKKGIYLGLITWIVAAIPFAFVMRMKEFPVILFPICLVATPLIVILIAHFILKSVPVGRKEINGLKFGASLILVHIFLDFFTMLLSVGGGTSSLNIFQASTRSQINSFFCFYIFYFLGILLSWLTGRYEDKKVAKEN